MGTFTYDSTLRAEFDDRLLAHLQLVLGAKLRRGESLFFSWPKPIELGGGRTTVWVNPTVPLGFDYAAQAMPEISREWLEVLTKSASSNQGLHLIADPTGTTPIETLTQENLR